MSPDTHQRLFAFTLSATFALFVLGCDSTESRRSEFNREEGKYYRAYLDGDVRQARQGLEQLIQYCQSPKAEILEARGKAHDLFCAYGRLYLLEKRANDKDAAEVALTRARYWHLQDYEANADWQRRVALHEFLTYQTPEWFENIMGKLDKGANQGSEPRYLQYLPATQLEKGR